MELQNGLPCKKPLPEQKTVSPSKVSNYEGTTRLVDNLGSQLNQEKMKRAVIPTKHNPPPEMSEWLVQFEVKYFHYFAPHSYLS